MFMIAMVEVNACGSVKLTAILVEGAVDELGPAPLASRIISETLRLEFRRPVPLLPRLDPPLLLKVAVPLLLTINCGDDIRILLGLLFSIGIPKPKLRRKIPVVTALGRGLEAMIWYCCV